MAIATSLLAKDGPWFSRCFPPGVSRSGSGASVDRPNFALVASPCHRVMFTKQAVRVVLSDLFQVCTFLQSEYLLETTRSTGDGKTVIVVSHIASR